MTSLEDKVLEAVALYYAQNDLPLDAWTGPFEIFPDTFGQRAERRVLYQLADKGRLEERSGKLDLHYAIRLKPMMYLIKGEEDGNARDSETRVG